MRSIRQAYTRAKHRLRFALLARLVPVHPDRVAYYICWPDGDATAGLATPEYMTSQLGGDPIGRTPPEVIEARRLRRA